MTVDMVVDTLFIVDILVTFVTCVSDEQVKPVLFSNLIKIRRQHHQLLIAFVTCASEESVSNLSNLSYLSKMDY